jgi:uncharacterized membrane-anchored protein
MLSRLNADLTDPRWMYLKGALFLLIGLISAGLILTKLPTLKIAGLLALTIWAFCRAYYFAFYVIERYIDPTHKFAGLGAFTRYLLRKK